MFTIEKNIPLADRSECQTRVKEIANFIMAMEVWDSFFIEKYKDRVSVENSRMYFNKMGVKISIRKQNGGSRCWRIK